jgi:GTPase SAR1 family protein
MEISEHVQKQVKLTGFANNLDKELATDLPEFLPKHSGFMWIFVGGAGTGKTTLLLNLMTKKPHNGLRQSYRKVFDRVIVISPTLGRGSVKKDPFSRLPGEQMFDVLSIGSLLEVETMVDKFHSEGLHSLLILDDVGSALKQSKEVQDKLKQFVMNRRHRSLSMFMLVQKYTDVPSGVRANASHFCIWRPTTVLEREAITNDILPLKKDNAIKLFAYVYSNDLTDKYSFLYIDASRRRSSKPILHKNFNELTIQGV